MIPMQCRQQTRKTKTKLNNVFLIKLIENYLGIVDIGFVYSFSVECLEPLALSNQLFGFGSH